MKIAFLNVLELSLSDVLHGAPMQAVWSTARVNNGRFELKGAVLVDHIASILTFLPE